MKRLTTALLLLATTMPAHAATRSCRTTTTVRIRHISATSHVANHHAAQANLVITAFAVPVAVPVAPFAPYWYGIADYRDDVVIVPKSLVPRTLVPKLRLGTHDREAPLRRRTHDAELLEPGLPSGASQPGQRESASGASVLSQKCAACHGRTSPKMGLSLVDPSALSPDDRLRALRAVVTGAMPPEGELPLTDDDRAAILSELASEYPTEE